MRREGTLWLVLAMAGLAALVTWTQIGSLRYELIDHDEATFMVMAQSVLRGHLPYIEAFDNKPPGLFYALAATMWAFGQNVASTRLLGDVCILGSTLCLLAVGRKYLSLPVATALAAIFASAHLVKIAEYTSAAVVANLPMAAALLLLLRARRSYAAMFAAGMMLSVATLIRTNLGIVALAVALLLLVAAWRPGLVGVKRWAVVALGLGGLVPVGGLVATYAAEGQVAALWAAAVQVPLAYAGDGQGFGSVLLGFFGTIGALVVASPGSALLVLGTIGAGLVLAARWRRLETGGRQDLLVVLVMFGATLASMLAGGVFYPHYAIQLFPVATVLTGLGATVAEARWRTGGAVVAGVFAVASLGLATPDNLAVLEQKAKGIPYGLEQLAGELAVELGPDDRVWTIEHAMLLFYLDQPPVSPLATLPSMLFNRKVTQPLVDAGVVTDHEAERVMAMRPKFVVMRTGQYTWEAEDFLASGYETYMVRGEVTVLKRR